MTMTHEIEERKSKEMASIAREIKGLAPHIHSPVPNPAPLGLFAFGLTTALLQMKHTGLTGSTEDDMNGVEYLTWGFALFYGGLLQLVAGISEIKRNNIFGYTAFCSYGGFWMSLGTAEIVLLLVGNEEFAFNKKAIQAMLILMGIFTFILMICTIKMNKTISTLMFLLMMTFFLLAGGIFNKTVDKVAGWFGIATSAVAYWLGGAELVNDIIGGGDEIIPLGHWSGDKFTFTGGSHVPGRIHGVTHRTVLRESPYGPDDGNRNDDQPRPSLSPHRRISQPRIGPSPLIPASKDNNHEEKGQARAADLEANLEAEGSVHSGKQVN